LFTVLSLAHRLFHNDLRVANRVINMPQDPKPALNPR
jgi:hypothetical protein